MTDGQRIRLDILGVVSHLKLNMIWTVRIGFKRHVDSGFSGDHYTPAEQQTMPGKANAMLALMGL